MIIIIIWYSVSDTSLPLCPNVSFFVVEIQRPRPDLQTGFRTTKGTTRNEGCSNSHLNIEESIALVALGTSWHMFIIFSSFWHSVFFFSLNIIHCTVCSFMLRFFLFPYCTAMWHVDVYSFSPCLGFRVPLLQWLGSPAWLKLIATAVESARSWISVLKSRRQMTSSNIETIRLNSDTEPSTLLGFYLAGTWRPVQTTSLTAREVYTGRRAVPPDTEKRLKSIWGTLNGSSTWNLETDWEQDCHQHRPYDYCTISCQGQTSPDVKLCC